VVPKREVEEGVRERVVVWVVVVFVKVGWVVGGEGEEIGEGEEMVFEFEFEFEGGGVLVVVLKLGSDGFIIGVLALESSNVGDRFEDKLNTDEVVPVLNSGEGVVELAEGNGDKPALGSGTIDSDLDVVEGPPPNPLQIYAPIPSLLIAVVIVFSVCAAKGEEGLGPPVATTVPSLEYVDVGKEELVPPIATTIPLLEYVVAGEERLDPPIATTMPSLAINVFILAVVVESKEVPDPTPVPSPLLAINGPILTSISDPVSAVEDSQGEGPSGAGVYGTSAVTVNGKNAFVDAEGVSLERVEVSAAVAVARLVV
jgi:hypothetical protein